MIKVISGLLPGKRYAMQARHINVDGSTSEWSQVFRFIADADSIAPGNVTGLRVSEVADAFALTWDKIEVDANGGILTDFKHYKVTVFDGTKTVEFNTTSETFHFSRNMNFAAFGQVRTTLEFNVWAVDLTGNLSFTPANATTAPTPPPTPSAPTLGLYLGSITASWDGRTASNNTMPVNVQYAEVHVSSTSDFSPTTNTYVGRVLTEGSGSKFLIPGLAYNTPHYVKLVAVNQLGMRSAPSAQQSSTPERLSGVDVVLDQISPDQINFTARDIGGANAYYSPSEPLVGQNGVTILRTGDIWYDKDNGYTTYRYSGGSWVLDPDIGVVSGKKILAGTVTADAVGTNLLITTRANIARAVIDEAHITSVNAASIRTGELKADQRIIAGPALENHAEVTSSGFYVRGPSFDNSMMVDRIRMGTGISDFLAIPDPASPDSTLAQIDENGIASFQGLISTQDPVVGGRLLVGDHLETRPRGIVGRGYMILNGLEFATDANKGIRGPYGLGNISFEVTPGRAYKVSARLQSFYYMGDNNTSVIARFRYAYDTRTATQVEADALPTQPTINSPSIGSSIGPAAGGRTGTGARHLPNWETWFYPVSPAPNGAGQYVITVGVAIELYGEASVNSVIKIVEGASLTMIAEDMGPAPAEEDRVTSMGGALYDAANATPPPPPPPPPTRSAYFREYPASWVRSYRGDESYMSNGAGRAYQGMDPSGFNGNQRSYFGWNQVNFATLLTNATVDKIVIYVYFAHWYYNSGGTATIRYHNVFNDPGANPRGGLSGGLVTSSGWPKPGGREINVTGWASALKSGAFRGIMLGPGPSTSYTHYGYATSARIKVWYTK